MAKLHFRSYTTNQMVLFPQRIDENIAENDPVRIVSSIVDHLDMSSVNKLYNGMGRCPYHPRMMLKVIIYAYMNNIYSCRRIEQLLLRDIHFIWLAGYEKPDFITINRFRNRLKDEINNIFTQLVLVLAEKGFVSLDVEYVDGTKIESKANKYTFVWRKTVERNRARLIDKVKALLAQVDDCIAQDNTKTDETVEFTPSQLAEISAELNASLSDPQVEMDKEEKKKRRKLAKELKERSEKLAEYNQHLETLGDRNSYSKTDKDATFMHMKEDAINDGLTKPGYNLQIATENQFITNFALFPNPTDTLTYIPFMESFRERYGHFASTEVADSGYGSEENYEFMELNGTAAYVKYNRFHIEHRPQYVPDPFRSENFYYNKKEDYCVCPMGQHMTRTGTSHKTSASGYVSNRATYTAQNCEGCPLRCLCFDASGDRRVIDRNHKLEAYRQKASELLTSEEGLRHRGKRCIEPEAVFGQIKYNMAYRRFRHIGVDKVKMDFAFFAIAFNIKKMVAKMTKGGLFSYLRAYLTNITPYKLFIRLFFVEKQKLVVHPHKNVQRVFLFILGVLTRPRYTYFLTKTKQMEYADIQIDDIILRLFNGTASPDDIATLSRWMEKDAANRQYFEQQQREWNADGGGDIASTFDYEAAFGCFERHIAQDKDAPTADEYDVDETTPHRLWSINHPWLRLQLRVVASVAAVALIVIGTWLSYNRYTKQYADRFANMVNVEAPAGSRAKVMLPDGTAVWLNAGSQLSYSQGFGITNRNVRINGEGYFEVGKGSDMPMSVCSSNMCMRDIGTKFNFRDYPEEPTAEVTLCEGEVGVTSVKFPKHEVVIHPEQMTLLDKHTGRITATCCYSANKRLWTSGELVMDEMTIHQIITAIERAYKVNIVIESERVKHLQLCGTLNLDRENLDEILQVIATAGSISYKVKNKTVYLK